MKAKSQLGLSMKEPCNGQHDQKMHKMVRQIHIVEKIGSYSLCLYPPRPGITAGDTTTLLCKQAKSDLVLVGNIGEDVGNGQFMGDSTKREEQIDKDRL